MKTVQVDEFGDRATKNGYFVYLFDLDAVMQTCEQVMKQQLKELQYDQTKGIEYFNNVLVGDYNLLLFESQARAQIRAVSNVIAIVSFTYSLIDNKLSYEATIKTNFGVGIING